MRGLHEFNDGEKQRGVLFNFLAFDIVERNLDMQIDDFLDKLSPKYKGPKSKYIVELFYAAGINYCDFKKIDVDFSIQHAAGWISTIGLEKSMQLITEAVSMSTPKNSHPHPSEKVGT